MPGAGTLSAPGRPLIAFAPRDWCVSCKAGDVGGVVWHGKQRGGGLKGYT